MALSYKTGTVSVAAGGTVVTGVGTLWTQVLSPGDVFYAAGLSVPIASVVSDTQITLDLPWPGGALAAAAYAVLYSSPERFAGGQATRTRELVNAVSALLNAAPSYSVLTAGANAPPASPALDDMHVVGGTPTGAWAGQANALAQWIGSGWQFTAPANGWVIANAADSRRYAFVGGAWSAVDLTAAQIEAALFGAGVTDTPAITPTSGAFAATPSVSRRWKKIGRFLFWSYQISISAAQKGTASGYINAPLPFAAAFAAGGGGVEINQTGFGYTWNITAGGTPLDVRLVDNSPVIVANCTIRISGYIETTS